MPSSATAWKWVWSRIQAKGLIHKRARANTRLQPICSAPLRKRLNVTVSATVNVANVAPVVGAINAPAGPVQAGASVNVNAGFADLVADQETCTKGG